jgi:hypothetical protein
MRTFKYSWTCTGLIAVACCCLALPSLTQAQSTGSPAQGDNSVYIGSGQSQTLGGSVALVDATTFFAQNNSDICATIAYIVTTQYSAAVSKGVVVDARGINASPGSSLTCGNSPFTGVQGVPSSFSITILLPASTISIHTTWFVPSAARLVGEGQGATVIQGCSGSCFQGADLIDMGKADPNFCAVSTPSYYCQGIGIEHLTLDGNNVTVNGKAVNGIVDMYAQELSYVKDVGIINIASGGIGLSLATHYTGSSGPFSNIYYSGSGMCAQIFDTQDNKGINDTRGIHGLTCIAPSGTSGAAIKLDSSNNSIEDVYISGFAEGILVGSQFSAQGNLIFNVSGKNVSKLVHIAGNSSVYSNCPPGTANQSGNPNNVPAQNVCDLTILGATVAAGPSIYSIYDDITGAQLTDSTVGMYALGEQVPVGTNIFAYSRFTTSPSIPSWFVGSSPSGDTGCATGSLYSVTLGSSPTLWGCVNHAWKSVPGT